VALAIQHAERMRRIMLLSVACQALPHFPILPHTGHEFRREKIIEDKVRVLIFLQNCLKYFSF